MAILVFLNTIELTHIHNNSNPLYWIVVVLVMFITSVHVSANIYWGFNEWTWRSFFQCMNCYNMSNRKIFILASLLIGNIINWTLLLISFSNSWHFSTVILAIMLSDLALVKIHYILIKMLEKEPIKK